MRAALASVLAFAALAAASASAAPNTLSAAERAAGWRLLFDGHSFAGWKNYGGSPDEIVGWAIEDGALRMTRDVSFAGLVWNIVKPWGRASVDLMSVERFERFELALEWKISPGGNSGIFYLVPTDADPPWEKRGLEMQVLDDAGHADGATPTHRNGDLYDLVASARRPARPVGEWNAARIVVDGDRIEHWLNGEKVVEVIRRGPAWEALVAASKFADRPGYGAARAGHILLQDHGDPVWFRSIKLRVLP